MGASGGIPNIGVRLTADGVQDVIDAFERVRQEGKTTGVETSASLDLINESLLSLTELLPALSLVAAIDGVIELGKEALETADSLGKLSEKTGISVGTLSALSLAAKETDTQQDTLDKGLVKLTKSMQDAADGSVKPKKAFSDLGITMQDLNTKNPDQIFELVAQGLGDIENPGKRAQAAVSLFGKAGAELIPVLNSVAEDGLDALVDKAKLFGVYIDGDFVESAKAAKEGLADLGAEVQGAALQFTSGLLPGVTGATNALANMAGGAAGFRAWGQIVGAGVLSLAESFIVLDRDITETIATVGIWQQKGKIVGGMDTSQLFTGGTAMPATQSQKDAQSSALGDYKNTINQAKMDYANSAKILDDALAALYAPPKDTPTPKAAPAASGTGTTQAEADKLAKAKSAYLQAQADSELAILKTKNQLEEVEDKRSYDAGLMTLDAYYDARAARITAEAAAELQVLEQKREAALGVTNSGDADTKEASLQAAANNNTATVAQYKQLEDAQKAEAASAEVIDKENGQLAQNNLDRANAKHALALQEQEDIKKLQTATGDKFGAEETGLQIDLQNYDLLLKKIGTLTDAEREAAEAQYETQGQGKIAFEESQQSGTSAMNTLNQDVTGIQNQAANGTITNYAAQAQILELQKDSLTTLQDIGLQMFKNAVLSGNDAAVQEANKFNASLDTMRSKLADVTTAQTYLENQLQTQGITALDTFFTAGISGSKSFGDALGDLATTFENMVATLISKLLVFYALESLLGLVGFDSDMTQAIIGTSPFQKGFSAGGYTGDVAVDKIAGVVHGQEWVFDAPTTKANRSLFQAIQDGETPAINTVQSAMSVSSDYANETSATNSSMDIPAPIINITNTTNQPVQQKQRSGSGGQSITDIIIGAVVADIGKGGQVAQTMQSTYGVARQGTRKS